MHLAKRLYLHYHIPCDLLISISEANDLYYIHTNDYRDQNLIHGNRIVACDQKLMPLF